MSEVKEVLTSIDEVLKEDLSYGEDVNAIYKFDIKDKEQDQYQLVLKYDAYYMAEVETEEAEYTLKLASDDFVELAKGKLNGKQAFKSGKLKIKGNMGLALKLQSILTSFNKN